MRVLFASAPLVGHVLPLVPLSVAIRDAGHDVAVGTGGEAAAAVARAGLPVEQVAPALRFGTIAMRTMLRHPLIARAEFAGTAGTDGVSRLFGAVNERMVDGLVDLVGRFRPDLVVYEPLAVAGAIAGARAGVPAVLHENSLWDGPQLVSATAERMEPALHRLGVESIPPSVAMVTIAPPSVVGTRRGWAMRPTSSPTGGAVPDWLREQPERPRILVSRSTVAGPGSNGLMTAVVAAAPQLDADVVLVRPDKRVQRMAKLPSNVRTADWVPFADVLPTCAAVVHHGGAGTVLAALAAGLPQLAVPGPGDRRFNAEVVARRGAGMAVPAREITAAALRRLINDRQLAAAAEEVQRELAAMPAPAEIAVRLAELRP